MADRSDSLKLYEDQPQEVTTEDILRRYGPEPAERGMLLPISRTGDKLSLDWPSAIYEPYQAIKRLVTRPVAPGYLSSSGDRGPIEDSFNAAAAVAAPSLGLNYAGMAPKNAVGIFGGRLAKTADQAALARAEEMATKGADRRAIWDETGWFQGKDGKWRFEIPDNAAMFNAGAVTATMPSRNKIAEDIVVGMGLPKTKLYNDADVQKYAFTEADARLGAYRAKVEGNPLVESLAHSDLFAGYPDMASVAVARETLPTYHGTYKDNRITFGGGPKWLLDDTNPQADLSTVLHEAQHAIQDRERFAKGANKEMFVHDMDALNRKRNAYQDALFLQEQAAKHGVTVDEVVPIIEQRYGRKPGLNDYKPYANVDVETLQRALARVQSQINDARDPKEAYKRTAGEVEARNVQKRMNMTPEERRATPPWETQDVPDTQQILRMYGEGPQMSQSLPMDEASRLARAREMGFDTDKPWYHGTERQFDEFSLSAGRANDAGHYGSGVYFAQSPHEAGTYGSKVGEYYTRARNPLTLLGDAPAGGRDMTDAGHFLDWAPKLDAIGYLDAQGKTMLEKIRAADEIAKTARFSPIAPRNAPGDAWIATATLPDGREVRTSAPYWPRSKEETARFLRSEIYDQLVPYDMREIPALEQYVMRWHRGGSKELTERAKAAGHDAIRYGDELVVFDPVNIRSTKARFDPAKKGSANLLASSAPADPLTTQMILRQYGKDDE